MSERRTERRSFAGAQGFRLEARLEHPVAAPLAYAVFAHCFTCSKDYLAPTRISRMLAERSVAVLRFDFTGLGESQGDFADTNFSSNVVDVVSAATHLREHFEAPRILIGHSLGGLAALAAAPRVPESLAVVTIASPSEPRQLERHFTEQLPQINRDGEAVVEVAGRPFQIRRQLLEDFARWDMAGIVSNLGRALLLFHGSEDSLLDMTQAECLLQQARHPKRLVRLKGADHLLTRREDAETVAATIVAWAARFMPELDRAQVSRPTDAS